MLLGMLIGALLYSILVTKLVPRYKQPPDGKWVKIRPFNHTHTRYCNRSGCVKPPLSDPIEFGMCEKHYRMYWAFEPAIKTLSTNEYKAYGWMKETNDRS